MKKLTFFIVLGSMIILVGCKKSNDESPHKLNVEEYITQLLSCEYKAIDLPEFTYEDIPALLKYRNETVLIHDFPRNGISSLYAPDCKLGMFVLWTIESIRAVSINSEHLIMRFPSQNPILSLRYSDNLKLVYDNISHETASKAYYDWWENNKHENFLEFSGFDPLQNTDYKWH